MPLPFTHYGVSACNTYIKFYLEYLKKVRYPSFGQFIDTFMINLLNT